MGSAKINGTAAVFLLVLTTTAPDLSAQSFEDKLQALKDSAAKTHSEALLVYSEGQLIHESYFGKGSPDRITETMSCTKSIVAIGVAALIEDGLIDSLDVPIHRFYPEWKQGLKVNITVRHLLEMTSGIQNKMNTGEEIYPSSDFVQLALTAELTESPGEVFRYNNKALNLLAGIFHAATDGLKMDNYIAQRIFEPLRIERFNWTRDPAGNPHVMSGCQLTPPDFAKLGLLVLNSGKFEGEQVICESAVSEIFKPSAKNREYGLLWWIDYDETKYVVTPGHIAALRDACLPEEALAKMTELQGEYESRKAFANAVDQVFGENSWSDGLRITETFGAGPFHKKYNLGGEFRLFEKAVSGPPVYFALGYLGNFLAVIPHADAVVVRTISGASFTGPNDNFRAFPEMVRDIFD